MEFGKRLKELIKEKGISQQALAESIGFSQRAVSKWINQQAEPTENAIVKCAKYFGVSTDYLLGLSD